MKLGMASLALCLALAAPGWAQVLYDDGPINGTVDAWTINYGFVVGDTFTLSANSTVGGFNFGVWEFPGDVYDVGGLVHHFPIRWGNGVWLRHRQRREFDRPVHLSQSVWLQHRQDHGNQPERAPGFGKDLLVESAERQHPQRRPGVLGRK